MRTAEITLLFVATSDGVLSTWSTNAALTAPGGSAVSLTSAGSLSRAIQTLVVGASRSIANLVFLVDPPESQPWSNFTPPIYTNLSVPSTGLRLPVSIKICAPIGTPTGTHHMAIKVVGDASVYATFLEDITVPARC